MVHVPQVRQLVQHDVIPHKRRRLNQPPVQGNRPAPRARAPARPLIAHGDPPHRQLVRRREFQNPGRKLPRRQPPQMPRDPRAQIPIDIRDLHNLAPAPHRPALPVHSRFDPHHLPAKQNLRSHQPWLRFDGMRREPLQLSGEPFRVPFREPSSLPRRPPARNRQSRRAVRPQPQQIAARPVIPDHHQRNPPPPRLQNAPLQVRLPPFQKEIHHHSPSKTPTPPFATNSNPPSHS